MMEATSQAIANRPEQGSEPKPWHFGAPGKDPVELGRRGGSAPKRSKLERQLREKIVQAKNGQAAFSLLRVELEAQQARERELYRRDKELAELDTWLITVREQLDEAHEELRALDEQAEQRRADLERAMSDDAALVALVLERAAQDDSVLERVLSGADTNGSLERVLVRMNFITVVEDDE